MNKQLTQAYKEIGQAFEKHIKNSDIGAFYFAVATDGTLSVAFSGTEKEQFTAVAHFLMEHPEHMELFKNAIDCATEFHSEKQTSPITNFLN